ncbi:MAG: hypothetical protein KDD62_15585, partial [Bdellovibrionales bacterium]|nr:hypothetical protein [Bdellovibrionales bacterium]
AKTPDVSGLQKWINRFSQGKNAAGIQLYKQCPGACSPQYEYLLQKLGTGFEVDAHVICGPARNKWDNRYSISYGLRWICTAIDQ